MESVVIPGRRNWDIVLQLVTVIKVGFSCLGVDALTKLAVIAQGQMPLLARIRREDV